MSVTLAPLATVPVRAYVGNEDPFLFHRARTWWLLLALFLMAQGNGIFTLPNRPGKNLQTLSQYTDYSKANLFWLTALMCVICLGLMVKRIGPTLQLMLKQKAVLAFAVLAFLSTLWSQDPDFTFRKATLLFFSFAFAWFFATSYSPEDQIRLLLAVGVIVAMASIAMVVLLPQYGLDTGGEWKGVFGQKNPFGHAILFLFSGLAFRRTSSRRRLLTITFQAILPIGLIILSRSKGSLILAFLLIAVRLYGPVIKHARKYQLPFLLYVMVTGALVIAMGREIILSLLGRDSTLSGRTEEWAVLSSYALRHIWLGYGYQAFWIGGDSLEAMHAIRAAIHGADSGYMDTMLQFGLAGMVLWVVLLRVSMRDILAVFRRASVSLTAYWYLGLILATFLGSVTEGMFPSTTGLDTFGFVIACAGLGSLKNENGSAS